MWVDSEELKKLLKEKASQNEGLKNNVFDRMEVKDKHGKCVVRRIIKDKSGRMVYEEERELTVNPYTLQEETNVTYVTEKCECCNLPITGEMLASDQVKPCSLCGRMTCPRCRVNTDVDEYLKPEVRKQPLCQNCWNIFAKTLIIHCASCGQPVRNYEELKVCGMCARKVCASCSVNFRGILLCNKCYLGYVEEMGVQAKADEIMGEFWRRLL